MSIVVTAPAGNIGSVVVQDLLDAGEKPVLIARDPAKLKSFIDQGAVVRVGGHADAAFLTEATQDAEALFVLVPNDYSVQDLHAHYRSFAEAAAAAASANKIPHVVLLSSIGAELESGNGPVAGLYLAEKILSEAGIANLTFLRPSYFMENTLSQIPNILQANSLFTPFPTGTRFPMIATRDIGAHAAELLRKRDWSGTRALELRGAADVGYDDVASILSKLLEREIKHVTVSGEQLVEAMSGMGVSQVLAKSIAELCDAITTGKMGGLETRSDANTTPTTYNDFAEQVFQPAIAADATA